MSISQERISRRCDTGRMMVISAAGRYGASHPAMPGWGSHGGRVAVEIEHLDVLVVGAGLSGVGAGCHLETRLPGKSYAILEARGSLGGTWDLFRYPGVCSDSDMYTLGYSFRPWEEAKAIADGPSILRYVNDTADIYDIRRHIRYGHKVVRAEWSTED